ncbi:MAG: LysM peptidoglycan-binding domain-containing protein [Candidatus Azotimanducaceae bacterium]
MPALLADPPEITRKIAYTVRVGDSLARIAKRFGVGITDLAKWNRLKVQEYLQPGQRLTVYVDAINT